MGGVSAMGGGPMELIAKARAGEVEALGELCNLYRNYMRMVVRTGLGPKLRERVELSDVVQEALVEVVRQFPQFTVRTRRRWWAGSAVWSGRSSPTWGDITAAPSARRG